MKAVSAEFATNDWMKIPASQFRIIDAVTGDLITDGRGEPLEFESECAALDMLYVARNKHGMSDATIVVGDNGVTTFHVRCGEHCYSTRRRPASAAEMAALSVGRPARDGIR